MLFFFQSKTLDANKYATKKTIAQGMLVLKLVQFITFIENT